MARVFISHSSRDSEPAGRIKSWLHQQGFETPFLDFDKHAGIPPGADWEKTLYREIEQSEAVIVVQTPNWLESKWCFAEFTQARALGKPIFPVIETPTGKTLISPDIQALDLLQDREGGLEQLRRQLTQIALDAQGGFTWDASRSPFPGLLAFQEDDAAIYFGRDDDIRRLIERLNARRAQGGVKLIALLGASGSGKSSLLRAGVIPRLKRAGRNWVVLPPMRPQARPVDELARSLAVACGSGSDWRALRDRLHGNALAETLGDLASDLRVNASANEAQILLPIDQAEELFGTADPEQARRFMEILNAMLASDLPYLAVMALRSDYLGLLQSAQHLSARFEEFSLGPMPLARIAQIIEGPARVAGLHVDDALVHQAVQDAQTEDALPLLAFALRELYDRSAGGRDMSLAAYQALGDGSLRLTPLENAVRKAADKVLAEAAPGAEELAALRDAFVPAMVRVNDQGEYVRRPARWDDLPARAHPLLQQLAKARLLVLRQDGDARMVEVAHEALLRKWPRLRDWLDEAREFLAGKQQLEIELRDWQGASDSEKAGALLTGLKLGRAQGWLQTRPQQLSAAERDFIQAGVAQAEAEVQRRQAEQERRLRDAEALAEARSKTAQRTRIGMVIALCLAVLAGVAGLFAREQKGAAEKQAQVAEGERQKAEAATTSLLRAARERALELTRFVWTDLGAKQEEVQRLTGIARSLGTKPEVLVNSPIWVQDPTAQFGARQKEQPDGFDCKTGLESGFRYLYCEIRGVVNIEKAKAISGQSVFLDGGPHGKDVNLADAGRFGHYNPKFLSWLDDFVIPQGLGEDKRFSALVRLVYNTHIGPLVRALYHSHEILFADPAAQARFTVAYDKVSKDYLAKLARRETNEGRFDGIEPKPFETIKKDYLTRIEKGQTKDLGSALQEQFRWMSDYQATVHSDDWYLANTAGGFWVRRSIDRTEAQIFGLVRKVLQTFEPEVLAAR